MIGRAHRARRRSFLQVSGRKRWCGVASWARRQLRAKGGRRAGAKGPGRIIEAKTDKQGEGKTEKEVKLKQRTGEIEKKGDSGKTRDIYLYLQRERL